ncbi:MAG: hypothetical protein ACRDN0_27960 [Trebonia sp.]
MTFPDQPRGRRARPDNGQQDRARYDNVPREDREFPDLSPIRPRGGGRHSARHGNTGSQPRVAPWEGQPADEQQYGGQQHGGKQYGGQQYGDQEYGQAPPQYGQAPPVPSAPAAPRQTAQRPGSSGWDDQEDSNDPMAAFSERWRRRGQESPADRGKRMRLYMMGGGVLAVVVAVVAYFLVGGNNGSAANSGVGNLITSFLPGELQQVPNACTVVPNSTVSQYLPGQLKRAEPPLNSGAQTECTWTLDSPPKYRVLEVYINAYSPNALVGNGSATFAATFAAAEDETSLQHPGPKSGQPPATVANINNLGSSAFSAYQVFNEMTNGAQTTTDIASVYVRYRNVVVQVVLNGLAKGTGTNGKTYSGASRSQLQATVLAVAKQVTASVTG